MRHLIPIVVTFLLACALPAEHPPCAHDADCARGERCAQTTAGGICWPACEGGCPSGQVCTDDQLACAPAFSLSFVAPSPGAPIGPSSEIRVALAVGASSVTPPASITVTDGSTEATLANPQRSGAISTYAVSASAFGWTQSVPVTLTARAQPPSGPAVEASAPYVIDLVPPALAGVTASCAGGCVRDGTLEVAATATDASGIARVEVVLDLPGGAAVPLGVTSGNDYGAQLALAERSFPYFAKTVNATITATDAAGNQQVQTVLVPVTRLRYALQLDTTIGVQLTGVAVDTDGKVVVGGSTGKLYVVDPSRTVSAHQIATGAISAAPSIGPSGVWVGSGDGKVYVVSADGAVLNGTGCDTGGAVTATPAISAANPEIVFAPSHVGSVFAVDAVGKCSPTSLTDPFVASAAIDGTGHVYAVATSAPSKLHRFRFSGTAFADEWQSSVDASVTAPVLVDADGNIWTASQDGKLDVTTGAGVTATVKTLTSPIIDSPVIAANGDVVVGDQGKLLHRFTSTGASVWSSEPNLGAAVLAPVVLRNGDAQFIVPTAGGMVHAIRADGTTAWSGTLASGKALSEANVYTAPGAATSTAYFGCADGKLYAVVVDGELDATAPWPKSHHDPRNTGNVSTPLP